MRNHGRIPKKESLEIHAQVPQMQPCRVLGTVNFPATSLMFPGLWCPSTSHVRPVLTLTMLTMPMLIMLLCSSTVHNAASAVLLHRIR